MLQKENSNRKITKGLNKSKTIVSHRLCIKKQNNKIRDYVTIVAAYHRLPFPSTEPLIYLQFSTFSRLLTYPQCYCALTTTMPLISLLTIAQVLTFHLLLFLAHLLTIHRSLLRH